MDLDELRAFLAVARTGSMSSAAEEIGLAVVTLAGRIEALEKRLGLRLMRTSDRGISLTLPGLRLVEKGPRLLATAESAEARVLAHGDSADPTMYRPEGQNHES